MIPQLWAIEMVGHLAALLTFAATAAYVLFRRRRLRRMMRHGVVIYWLVFGSSLLFAGLNLPGLLHSPFLGVEGRAAGVAAWFDLVSEYPTLIAQCLLILVLISSKIMVERSPKRCRVLAIGAHPDDLEIACGGTLAKMHDAGYEIRGLVLTRGEQGGNAEHRPLEALRAAEFMGLNDIQVYNFCDTLLAQQAVEIVGVLEAALAEFHPDIILTHSVHDIHQDHQTVHAAVCRAGRNSTTILSYESPSVTQEFTPAFFVDIESYLDVKIESVREHWDQRSKPYMQPERVRGTAVFRGGQAKVRYAEGFEVVRALSSYLGGI